GPLPPVPPWRWRTAPAATRAARGASTTRRPARGRPGAARRRTSIRYAPAAAQSSIAASPSLVHLLRIRSRQLHQEPSDLLAHRFHVLPSLLRGYGRGVHDVGFVGDMAPQPRRPSTAVVQP